MRPDPKNTLTGLRARLDHHFACPGVLDRAGYDRLDEDARADYDTARLNWFGAGFWVRTAETMDLLRTVRGYLRTSDPWAVGERNVVLDGPANIGKTTMLLRLAGEIEHAEARVNPNYRRYGIVPVVYVEVAPRSTPKMIAATILDFFATPVGERRTQRELVRNAIDVMLSRQVRLLEVDELQTARLDGRQADDAIDTLKSIINNAGVVTVLSGIDITDKLASRAAEQIMGRGEVRRLRPFSHATDTDRARWAALVTRFAEQMHLLDADPGDVLAFADPLHTLTGGRIGTLRRVLARAMAAVIDDKPTPDAPEAITEEHLFGATRASALLAETATPAPRADVVA